MRFDLTDLRLFLHTVDAESITQGAERAGMALASASARIRGMEEAGGVPLLDRFPRGVRATPAGEALAHHARIVLGQMEQMRGDLHLYAQGLRGTVRVLSSTSGLTNLPEPLLRFLADHPFIDIDLTEKQSVDIVANVAAGLADIGIAADSADTGPLETRPFASDRLVVIAPENHKLASRPSVSLREVLDEPFIGLPADTALQAHLALQAAREGRSFKIRVRFSKFEAICAMVGGGIGLAIIPEILAQKHRKGAAIRLIPLSDGWAQRRLLICARKFSALPVHARKLISYLTDEGKN